MKGITFVAINVSDETKNKLKKLADKRNDKLQKLKTQFLLINKIKP